LKNEIREGLINFLVRNNPEALPRGRNLNVGDEAPKLSRRKSSEGEATPGAEHERGDKSPGVHAEETPDGSKR
ncbi:MAG TPA: hypothetical protein VJ721_05360, partial [Chthoniobacterales bacterium]|nr:hypothetical protein [Chthoniobacterales bacterium]